MLVLPDIVPEITEHNHSGYDKSELLRIADQYLEFSPEFNDWTIVFYKDWELGIGDTPHRSACGLHEGTHLFPS